jgi:hypothetical protein
MRANCWDFSKSSLEEDFCTWVDSIAPSQKHCENKEKKKATRVEVETGSFFFVPPEM